LRLEEPERAQDPHRQERALDEFEHDDLAGVVIATGTGCGLPAGADLSAGVEISDSSRTQTRVTTGKRFARRSQPWARPTDARNSPHWSQI
jgi:enoyl-CoA hydratase/carnithine racemase